MKGPWNNTIGFISINENMSRGIDFRGDSCTIIIEIAYHANDGPYRGVPELKPNASFPSIGVEICVEKYGSILNKTVDRTSKIVAELCKQYKLNENLLVRHYDITHKRCPTPLIGHPSQFTAFKQTVVILLKPASAASDKLFPHYK
ncbi:N-acetylmuramoyl-L-alanine amidase [Bacillus sp. 1P06AnD]|uniref:N-acetylmuramoyl-L-alanine amidase n=1 Tax=Bacillus sp. 1P06AnD TaxID=3132208 RepID=UPI0039A2B50C